MKINRKEVMRMEHRFTKPSPTCGDCKHTRYYHAKGGCMHGFEDYMNIGAQNHKAGRETTHKMVCKCKKSKLEV